MSLTALTFYSPIGAALDLVFLETLVRKKCILEKTSFNRKLVWLPSLPLTSRQKTTKMSQYGMSRTKQCRIKFED